MTAVDNMLNTGLIGEMDLVRAHLEAEMLGAEYGPEKEAAKRRYIAFASVAISARATKGFDVEIARRTAAMEADQARMLAAEKEAREKWGAELGADIADGELLIWLLGELAKVSHELTAALKVRPSVMRMSEAFSGGPVASPVKSPEAAPVATPPVKRAAPRQGRGTAPAATPAPAKGKAQPKGKSKKK